MWRNDSLEKTLMLGKVEGRRRRGRQRMRCLDGITDSLDRSLNKLWETLREVQALSTQGWFLKPEQRVDLSQTWESEKNQLSSITQSYPTLCDPMDCSTPGLPVYHQLPELTQTHVHQVSDAIQPSHPLSSPSPPAFNLSQHQGLFQWVSSSYQVAKVLELQHQSFQWIFRDDFF